MIKLVTFLSFFILITSTCFSQKFLAIDTFGKTRRLRYYQVDPIDLVLKNQKRVSGPIISFQDSSFVVGTDSVYFNQIDYIKTGHLPYGLGIISAILINGGLGFLAIDATNRLINEEHPTFRPRALNASLGAAGIGVLIPVLVRKRVRINKKRRVHIIDLSL